MPKNDPAQIEKAAEAVTRNILATLGLKDAIKAARLIRAKLLAEKERRNAHL